MQDHTEIAELERRISSALDRIGRGLDRFPGAASSVPPSDTPAVAASAETKSAQPSQTAQIAKLHEALEAEMATNAQLTERLKSLKERDTQSQSQLEAKVEKMTKQLDVQGLELQRMRKSTVQLREHLRILHEAAAEGMAEPHLINKAMLAELESLRATRHTEIAEMDEILAELEPLIQEARAHG